MRIHSPVGEDCSAPPHAAPSAWRPEGEASPRGRRAAGDRLAPGWGGGMGGMRGSIADTIAGARASLKNPSRPFTPADPLRRLGVHSLLPGGDQRPPTALVETSNFEGERPFTQHQRSRAKPAPLPATAGLGGPGALEPLGGMVGGAGLSQTWGGGVQRADVLSLEDDDGPDLVARAPGRRPSSRSGRVGSAARREAEDCLGDLSAVHGAGGASADAATAAAASAWPLLEAQLPVLMTKGRKSGGNGDDAARVMDACDKILKHVSDFDLVHALTTEQRSAVVKAAAACLDIKDLKQPVEIMAKAAKVILAVTKGGTNLLAVAKLLFRLSKNAAHDEVLRAEGISRAVIAALLGGGRLESVLGHMARLSDQCEQEVEAVMLLLAVLKNMSADSSSARELMIGEAGLDVVTSWLRALVRQRRQSLEGAGVASGAVRGGGGVQAGEGKQGLRRMKVEAHARAALVQALGVMRNLAVVGTAREAFVTCGAIRGTVEVMALWQDDQEMLLNASRVLSKVSMSQPCQDEMAAIQLGAGAGVHSTLLDVLARESDKLALVVRVVFVLGSLTGADEGHRKSIAAQEGALDLLLSLLVTHVDALLLVATNTGDANASTGDGSPDAAAAAATRAAALANHPSQDLLVKLMRLLAHLAISPEVREICLVICLPILIPLSPPPPAPLALSDMSAH